MSASPSDAKKQAGPPAPPDRTRWACGDRTGDGNGTAGMRFSVARRLLTSHPNVPPRIHHNIPAGSEGLGLGRRSREMASGGWAPTASRQRATKWRRGSANTPGVPDNPSGLPLKKAMAPPCGDAPHPRKTFNSKASVADVGGRCTTGSYGRQDDFQIDLPAGPVPAIPPPATRAPETQPYPALGSFRPGDGA